MLIKSLEANEEDNMNKNYEWNEVQSVESIRDLMKKATEQAGSKIAFMYKEGKEDVEITYEKFQEDTIAWNRTC